MSNVVEFSIKAVDEFSATMGKLDSSIGMVQKAFTAVAAAYPVYKAVQMAKASLDGAEAMGLAAQKANMAVEQFSALAWAAGQANVEQGTLAVGLKMLGRAIAENDLSPAGKALEHFGVAAKDASGNIRPTIDVLLELSDVFAKSHDDANKTKAAMELFGRSGTEMLPMLNQGREGIEAMMKQAQMLGVVISEEFAASADQVNDNLATMSAVLKGSVNIAMQELSPILEQATGMLIQFATEGDNVKNIGESIAAAFRIVMSVIVGVTGTFRILGNFLGGFFAAIAATIRGDFSEAMTIMKDTVRDAGNNVVDTLNSVKNVWDENVQSAAAAEAKRMSALRKSADSMKNLARETESAKLAQEQYADVYKRLNEMIKSSESPEESHIRRLREIATLERDLGGSSDELRKAKERENREWERARVATEKYRDGATSVGKTIRELYTVAQRSLGSVSFQIAQGLLGTFNTVAKGIGDAAAASLVEGKSLSEGLESLAKNALKMVISMLIEMGIQRLVLAAIDQGTTMSASIAHKSAAVGDVFVNSFASAAAIPLVGWAIAPQVATANTALALSGLPAAMAAGAAAGAAHGGLEYVPKESTYLLDKGERVLSPNQNADLNEFMRSGGGGGSMMVGEIHLHILENATNADAFARMNPIELRNALGKPVIEALNEMFKVGQRPNFATQRK